MSKGFEGEPTVEQKDPRLNKAINKQSWKILSAAEDRLTSEINSLTEKAFREPEGKPSKAQMFENVKSLGLELVRVRQMMRAELMPREMNWDTSDLIFNEVDDRGLYPHRLSEEEEG